MIDDEALLRRYASDGDETAFRELVDRYLPLVFATAQRRVQGDCHLAENVAQNVFARLAVNAAKLQSNTVIAAWLYRVTRFLAAKAVRGEHRRRARETAVVREQHDSDTHTPDNLPDWDAISTHLDEAMSGLGDKDRTAILLRFFRRLSFEEVGQTLKMSDDAAQKRVTRALEKLRALLLRRGVALSVTGLAGLLATNAVATPPPSLWATISHSGASAIASAAKTSGITHEAWAVLGSKAVYIVSTLALLSLAVITWCGWHPFHPQPVSPPAGLIAWWTGDGTAADLLGKSYGTARNRPQYAPAMVGQGFQLDGVDGVQVARSGTLNVGVGNGLSIEAWIKPDEVQQQHPLVEWNDGQGDAGVHLWISVGGRTGGGPGALFANIVDAAGNGHWITSPTGLIEAESWVHVALTYDRSSGIAMLYLGGATVKEQTLGSFTPQTSYDLFLGWRPAPPRNVFYFGQLDEVSVYDRALTSNEIHAIVQAGSQGKRKEHRSAHSAPDANSQKPL